MLSSTRSLVVALVLGAGSQIAAAQVQVRWETFDMRYATAVANDGTVYGTGFTPEFDWESLVKPLGQAVTPLAFPGFTSVAVDACSADGATLLAMADDSFSGRILIKHHRTSGTTVVLGQRAEYYNGLHLSDDGVVASAAYYSGTCVHGKWWNGLTEYSRNGTCSGPGARFVQYSRVSRNGAYIAIRTDVSGQDGVPPSAETVLVNVANNTDALTCLNGLDVGTFYPGGDGTALSAMNETTGTPVECSPLTGVRPASIAITDASLDGLVRVGYASASPFTSYPEVIETPESPQLSVQAYLAANGVDVSGWSLFDVTRVSSNGRFIVGTAYNVAGNVAKGFLIERRPTGAGCDSIDFNDNGVFPEDQDVVDFFNVLAGGACAACNDIDFNNNGVFPEDQDVVDFFNVLAGGTCPQ